MHKEKTAFWADLAGRRQICSHKSKLLKKPCFCLVSPAKSSLAAVGGEEMGNAHVGLRAQWGGSMQITIKKLI